MKLELKLSEHLRRKDYFPKVVEVDTIEEALSLYNQGPYGTLGIHIIDEDGQRVLFAKKYKQEFLAFIRAEWEQGMGIDKNPNEKISWDDAEYLFEKIRDLDLYLEDASEDEHTRGVRKEYIFQNVSAQLLAEGITKPISYWQVVEGGAAEGEHRFKMSLTKWEGYWKKALDEWGKGQVADGE